MTPADRARIATTYGITGPIPDPHIIKAGVSSDRLLTPKERINVSFAAKRLGNAIASAERRAGNTSARECRTWGEE